MSTVDRPLRQDAERNRLKILGAARELFAMRGLEVTLDDIAAAAGLGVGTVYRRFSSRDELIEALFEERVVEIVQLADEALEHQDPWLGLTGFLERVSALQAADRGLKEALLGTSEGRGRVARVRETVRPRADELVRRAQAAGMLREDFAASDLPLIQMMLTSIADITTPEHERLWRRFLVMLFDGMRADGAAPSPLPEPPLPLEALDGVMCRWRPPRWRAAP
jgi:AcrR family transcriptional regulator